MSEKIAECGPVSFVLDHEDPSVLIKMLPDAESARFSVKAALNSAAKKLPWTRNRVKDVWYGDRRISVSRKEHLQLTAAVAEAKRLRCETSMAAEERRVSDELQIVRKELAELRRIIAAQTQNSTS